MPSPIATGQISIVDFTDAPSLTAFITTTSPKTQAYDPATTTFSPDWSNAANNPVLVPSLFISTVGGGNTDKIADATVTWYDSADMATALTTAGNYVLSGKNLKITGNVLTVSPNVFSKTYVANIVWTDPQTSQALTIRSDFTFNRANAGGTGATGAPAATAVLSNETHMVPTDSGGNNGAYGGASTQMSVFLGANEDTGNWTFTQSVVDLTGTASTASGSGATAKPANSGYTVTGFAAGKDQGYVDITATKSSQTLTKRFTVSKSKAGINSIDYSLNIDTKLVTKNASGTMTPASINISQLSQSGSGAPATYQGRLSIEESSDGTTWLNAASTPTAKGYTSSANETGTKNYIPSSTAKYVRVRMYATGVAVTIGTNVLDEEVVQITSDLAAITSYLTNDSQSIASDSAGTIATFPPGVTSTMKVMVGNVDDSANWTYDITTVAPSNASATISTNTVTATGLTADTGTITITAKKSGQPNQTQVFTLTKNKQGIQGIPANQYWLTTSVKLMTRASLGTTLTPGTFDIVANTQNGSSAPALYAGRIIVEESTDGSAYAVGTGTYAPTTDYKANNLPTTAGTKVTYTPTTTAKFVRVRLYTSGTTVTAGLAGYIDEEVITIVPAGDPPTAILTNEFQSVPTLENGTGGTYTSVTTQMKIYVGGTEDTTNWSFAVTESGWTTAGTLINTAGATRGTWTSHANGLSGDSGYVDFTASKSGFSNLTKRFTVSKNKQGIAPTSYWIISPPAIGKNPTSGSFTPAAITTIAAKAQTGSATAGAYAGRFIIEQEISGAWSATNKYTSAANEASVARFPTGTLSLDPGCTRIRVQLYAAGGTTTLLDEEIIQVVFDGNDAVFVSAWAPNGNLFKNSASSATLTAQADVYKGGALQNTGFSYEWYVQVTGNADEGAGAGWKLLTDLNKATYGVSGSISASSITVAASGITNLAAFRAKVYVTGDTDETPAWYDTIIFYDQTDPILVVVDSSNGNIFKNGSITSQLLCRLYQNGEEIDLKQASATTGYTYTYTWSKLDKNGNQDANFGGAGVATKTGKWIDITSSDVSQKAVFKVEIS